MFLTSDGIKSPMLQISAQGGQGGWGHQDCPRLRSREREDCADAGAAGRDDVRYEQE